MKVYLDLLQDILEHGIKKQDRTGVGTLSVFGRQLRFDLSQGFPLLTTKKMFWKGIVGELLWLLSGSTNVKPLQEQGIHIWDAWSDKQGELGPTYGASLRRWRYAQIDEEDYYQPGQWIEIDQVSRALDLLKTDPDSRRIIVDHWHPGRLHEQRLPPCHLLWQLYSEPIPGKCTRRLSLHMYQRSVDAVLGFPFNIASYALLTHLIASVTPDTIPGELVISTGDTHIYANQVAQARLQLKREPLPLPFLILKPKPDLFSYTLDDILLTNYHSYPAIKAPIAV